MAHDDPPRAVRLHAALAVGLTLSTVGFGVELDRALAGHLLAWAYVVQWPVLGAVGTYFWWRLLHEREPESDAPATQLVRLAAPTDDPELAAWQDYVAGMERGPDR